MWLTPYFIIVSTALSASVWVTLDKAAAPKSTRVLPRPVCPKGTVGIILSSPLLVEIIIFCDFYCSKFAQINTISLPERLDSSSVDFLRFNW
jgi:hypothetical protein